MRNIGVGEENLINKLLDLFEAHRIKAIKKKFPLIDKSVRIGYRTNIYGDGIIKIGEGSKIGNDCILSSDKGTKIEIGKRVMFSHKIAVYTSNPISMQDFSKKLLKNRFGNVVIGDFCWIGYGVFIREGVTIGNNCIVGANSVVLEDVNSFTLVAGNPAVPKKFLNGWKTNQF